MYHPPHVQNLLRQETRCRSDSPTREKFTRVRGDFLELSGRKEKDKSHFQKIIRLGVVEKKLKKNGKRKSFQENDTVWDSRKALEYPPAEPRPETPKRRNGGCGAFEKYILSSQGSSEVRDEGIEVGDEFFPILICSGGSR